MDYGKTRIPQSGTSSFLAVKECKHLCQDTFIIPTDAHYYENHRMLKQFKIITLAPTCFGSRRNHHQGAILYLAKTTEYDFLCSPV